MGEPATLTHALLYSMLFSLIGVVVFGVAFFVIAKIMPFSIRKEIEEDQNTALGIILGAVVLGLALIISAAMRG